MTGVALASWFSCVKPITRSTNEHPSTTASVNDDASDLPDEAWVAVRSISDEQGHIHALAQMSGQTSSKWRWVDVDTGATICVFEETFLASIGAALTPQRHQVTTPGGPLDLPLFEVSSIRMYPTTIELGPVLVGGCDGCMADHGMVGVLGNSVLGRRRLKIEWESDSVLFFESSRSEDQDGAPTTRSRHPDGRLE